MLLSLQRSILRQKLAGRRCTTIAQADMSYTYKYPRPAVTVDAAIVARPQGNRPPQLLLIKRKFEPFKDSWALPGGFVDENEGLDAAAARELKEETSVEPSSVLLTQVRVVSWEHRACNASVFLRLACSDVLSDVTLAKVGSFGDPGRDPRGWTVTVAYGAIVPDTNLGVKAADDAREATWFDVGDLPKLAFDHKLVVRETFRVLAGKSEAAGDLQKLLLEAASKLEGPWRQD